MKFLNLFILIAITGCVSTPKPKDDPQHQRVSIMTYNLENLFDTEDDPIKEDEAFLPSAHKTSPMMVSKCYTAADTDYRRQECLEKDWNEKVLKRKLRRLSDVISRAATNGSPDILFVQEVENQAVLERLNKEYLKGVYKTVIVLEGEDPRGIDVGLMSKFDLAAPPLLHSLTEVLSPYKRAGEDKFLTRGILQVDLKLPNQKIMSAFVMHLPSQSAQTEVRAAALTKFNEIATQLPQDRLVVGGGDLNWTYEDEGKTPMLSQKMKSHWRVSHLEGCKSCDGTYYYNRKRQWSFFDVLLFSKNSEVDKTYSLDTKSIRIPVPSAFQINRYGSPSRFGDGMDPTGVSDHWPMYSEILIERSVQ